MDDLPQVEEHQSCELGANDKAEGASALVPGASTSGSWPANQLTASGTFAKQIISGWGGTTPPQQRVIATIQAEAFSQMSGIQTENTADTGGGTNVGWIDTNDWLSYQNSPVTIPTDRHLSHRVPGS